MAPEVEVKQKKVSKEEYDIISNRLAVALAKRESLIKSWTASSSRKEAPSKTQEERDAEDATLFRNQPPYLGVGAPIPAHFFVSDASQENKSLRAKFFPASGLKASKARDVEEKAASAKRAKRDEDSDEEQGRSALGRAKKLKSKPRITLVAKETPPQETSVAQEELQQEPEGKKAKKVTPEREESAKEETTHTGLENKNGKLPSSQPKEPVEEQSNEVSADNSLLPPTSTEDIPMPDTEAAEGPDGPAPKSIQTHAMDPQERKRMKKREKKKRMRAKQKAAISSAE